MSALKRRTVKDPYRTLGIGLIAAGVVFAPVSYFIISSMALTATGVIAVMVGFTCMALASARPYLSPEAARVLLEAGMENVSSLLEELALQNRAVYVPSSMRNGRPQALVPLTDGTFSLNGRLAGRMVVRYGSRPEEVAIAVATPGGVSLRLVRGMLGPEDNQIEAALSYLMVGILDLGSSVSVVRQDGLLTVTVNGARLHWENVWYYRVLGSPLASMAATVVCESLGKPVRIREERLDGNRATVALEVLS